MLLIREAARLVRDIVQFSLASRRFLVLVVALLVAIAVLLSVTVTTVAPVALYPFL